MPLRARSQTHWLSDVFGTPEPLGPPPHLADEPEASHLDVRINEVRRSQDSKVIASMLGRTF